MGVHIRRVSKERDYTVLHFGERARGPTQKYYNYIFFYNSYYHVPLIDLEYSWLDFYSVSAEYQPATGDHFELIRPSRRR